MRLRLQDYCPKNKTTEVIFLFSYPNILFFPLLWKMLFLHFLLFLPSHELFYLPGAHKFPSQYHLTDILCLPRNTLKRYSLTGQTLFSYPAPPETLQTLWLLKGVLKLIASFWLPQESPAACGVVKKLSCKIWEAEDPKGSPRYIHSNIILHIILHL